MLPNLLNYNILSISDYSWIVVPTYYLAIGTHITYRKRLGTVPLNVGNIPS